MNEIQLSNLVWFLQNKEMKKNGRSITLYGSNIKRNEWGIFYNNITIKSIF